MSDYKKTIDDRELPVNYESTLRISEKRYSENNDDKIEKDVMLSTKKKEKKTALEALSMSTNISKTYLQSFLLLIYQKMMHYYIEIYNFIKNFQILLLTQCSKLQLRIYK